MKLLYTTPCKSPCLIILNKVIFVKKKIAIVLIFILIMALPFQILAQDDEETDYIWLKQEIEIAQNIKEPVIYSKSAVIYDRGSKTILYGKNEHERLPMASTTKIMTAIILVENVRDLSKEIEVVKEARAFIWAIIVLWK